MRTKAQIIEAARRAAQESLKTDAKMRRIATKVYAKNYAQLMLQLGAERASTSGGFFPQVGTNLTATIEEKSEENKEPTPDPWTTRISAAMGIRRGRRSDPLQGSRDILPEYLGPDPRTLYNV